MTIDHDAMTYFAERGFELWNTGGNCTAFGQRLDDGKSYVLVSNADAGTPPVTGETIQVGIYNHDQPWDGYCDFAATFEDALTKLNALIEKHVK